jgi:cysteine desulfurase
VSGAIQGDRVYLDYAGFAPVDPRVLAVMRPFLEAGIGNPSATHSLGVEARESLDAARAKVARLCGGAAAGVIFTSGATEANNLAIRGVVGVNRGLAGARVLRSAVEHVSVVTACQDLERSGATVVVLPVDEEGRVDPDSVRAALTTDTVLISVGAASSESGTLQPLAEIGGIANAAGVPFHVDGVGALGRVPLAVDASGIDLLSLSGNDLYGPPGTGALWARPGVKLDPLMLGGGQERGCRPGTENVPGLVGLGVAAELMRAEAARGENDRLAELRDRLLDGLLDALPGCRVTGSRTARLPQHLSVAVRGVEAEGVLLDLDLAGVSASTGAGPRTLDEIPSRPTRAPGEMEAALCFTLGRWSTAADVDTTVARLAAIVARLRALAPSAVR